MDSGYVNNRVLYSSTKLQFNSFNTLKKHLGSPGKGNHWHHVVEKSQIAKSGFAKTKIHNTSNIISIDKTTHSKITGFYNSIQPDISGSMRVREWLVGQSYEVQHKFGVDILKRFGVNT